MAQSSVTLFGVVDAAVARISAGGANRTGITTSGLNSSRLGFRGTEDLGGGMAASFWLEGALHNDAGLGNPGNNGAFDFQRRSTVSLSGAFGEVRLGRDYAPTFWNLTIFDPFGINGVGSANSAGMLGAPVRTNNSIAYFLPNNLGGFYGQFQYAFGEQASNAANDKQGNYVGLRAGFANGPVDVAFATGKLNGATSATDVKMTNVAFSYNLAVVKPMLVIAQEKKGTSKITALELGAVAPIGAGELRAALSNYNLASSKNDWRKLAVGYGYNLSKRTQVYTTYARVANKGTSQVSVSNNGLAELTATPGGNASGFELGIRHSF